MNMTVLAGTPCAKMTDFLGNSRIFPAEWELEKTMGSKRNLSDSFSAIANYRDFRSVFNCSHGNGRLGRLNHDVNRIGRRIEKHAEDSYRPWS